ncbi:YjgN family protein [Xenophilus aerolatus]|nr:YjgN family protein [Xenophilus aerolatus]
MPEPTFQHPDFAPDLTQFERAPPGPPASPPPGARSSGEIEPWRLAFTGDGGVYFGVWIVNVLLTIVTLGLFTPWARRRTIKYFYGHTLVADSPLEFTAGIRGMVFGFLLLAAFYIALNVASNTGQHIVYFAIVSGGAVLAPFLWGSAMRFRLGHTRWRGLRLRITAGWGEVYRASWPVFALAAVWLVAGFALARMAPEAPTAGASSVQGPATLSAPVLAAAPARENEAAAAEADPAMDADDEDDGSPAPAKAPPFPRPTWPMAALALAAVLLSLLCLIRLEFNYKRLLVTRAAVGGQTGRWKPVFGDFVRIWGASIGFFVVTLLGIGVAIAALIAVAALVSGGLAALGAQRGSATFVVIAIVAVFVLIMAMFFAASPALAYREARMFQLMWNSIGVSDVARFKTDLRAASFVWLRIRNILLNLLTAGFYRPFARVAEYKMKTESVTLHVKGGLDRLVGTLEAQQKDGFGDAVADALGIDVIG